jgi:hypothetical protein
MISLELRIVASAADASPRSIKGDEVMGSEDWVQKMLNERAAKKESAKLEGQNLNMAVSASTGMLYRLSESLKRSVAAYKTLSGDDSVHFVDAPAGACVVKRRLFPMFELQLVLDPARPVIKCMLMTREAEDVSDKNKTSEIKIVNTGQDSFAFRLNGSLEADENVIAKELLKPLLEKL